MARLWHDVKRYGYAGDYVSGYAEVLAGAPQRRQRNCGETVVGSAYADSREIGMEGGAG